MTTTPEMIDLLIEARWIATVAPDQVLKSHAVAVDDGRILAILPAGEARTRYRAKQVVSLHDHILIPGLINLHTPAAMSLMRGLADDHAHCVIEVGTPHLVFEADRQGFFGELVHVSLRTACAMPY